MTIKELITQVRENYLYADIDQLEVWLGQLSTEFAWIAQNMGETKANRAQQEIAIKKRLLQENGKCTEKEIEREYYATSEGQFLALNGEYQKAISKLITACRYKAEALRGRI